MTTLDMAAFICFLPAFVAGCISLYYFCHLPNHTKGLTFWSALWPFALWTKRNLTEKGVYYRNRFLRYMGLFYLLGIIGAFILTALHGAIAE